VEFGSSAIGGVINLTTEGYDGGTGDDHPRLNATSSIGSFNTRRYLLDFRSRLKRLNLRVSAGFTGSDGDFPFVDDRPEGQRRLYRE